MRNVNKTVAPFIKQTVGSSKTSRSVETAEPITVARRSSCNAVNAAKAPAPVDRPGTAGFIGANGSLPNLPPVLREQLLAEQASMNAAAQKAAAKKKSSVSLRAAA